MQPFALNILIWPLVGGVAHLRPKGMLGLYFLYDFPLLQHMLRYLIRYVFKSVHPGLPCGHNLRRSWEEMGNGDKALVIKQLHIRAVLAQFLCSSSSFKSFSSF